MPVLHIAGQPDINVVRTPGRGGTPIVLLHALGLDLSVWQPQFDAFGAGQALIALDFPGHGLSGQIDDAPTFARLAQVVADVLAQLQTGPVHLVGISVGGMIAQTLAVDAPHLVSSLCVVATSCTFPDPVRAALRERAAAVRAGGMAAITPLHLARWLPSAFHERRPDVIDRLGKILLRQDGQFHARMWDMVAELDVADGLAAIGCPVMVVAGEQDPSASPEAARAIVRRIAGARLEVIPGSGHFPQMEYPLAFNALLQDFLALQP